VVVTTHHTRPARIFRRVSMRWSIRTARRSLRHRPISLALASCWSRCVAVNARAAPAWLLDHEMGPKPDCRHAAYVAMARWPKRGRSSALKRALRGEGADRDAAARPCRHSALMDVARLNGPPEGLASRLPAGPRHQPAGRIGRADLGVRLILEGDSTEAARIAHPPSSTGPTASAVSSSRRPKRRPSRGRSPRSCSRTR